jgi:hypothetical protein
MKKFFAAITVCLLLLIRISYAQTPSIISVTPLNGPVGTTVTITGTAFNTTAANNIVHFGVVRANVVSATATSLTVTSPAGTGFQYIKLLNNTSKLTGYSSLPFTTTFSGCTTFDVNFLSALTNHTSSTTPRTVIFSDLDNDGKADMIATNVAGNNMSVFRNLSTSGVPSFASKIDFAAGVGTSGISTGDLNGDGKLDIVVSNYNSMDISIFINTTVGSTITFATRVDIAAWDVWPASGFVNPLGVVIQDLNGDGKPDIAVANFSTSSLALFRNTTVGATLSFVRQMHTTGLNGPRELAAGDMDADGKADLVVSDETGNRILAYRNTSPTGGAFTFDAPIIATTGTAPRGIALGDVDGDGKQDVAVVNMTSNSVSVFRNTSVAGTISVSPKTDFTAGTSPREIALADLNGDGRPEMAASSNTASSAGLSGFRNTSAPGTISFAPFVSFPAGNNALGVALQDVDNDGKIDAAVTSNSTGTVGVFRNLTTVQTLTGIVPITLFANSVCDNGTWKTVYNSLTNNVIAAVKSNANNLGAVTSSLYVDLVPGTVLTGQRYLARHFVVSAAVAPSTPVQVRLYITNLELLALRLVDPTILSISDLNITTYTGPGEDGTYTPSAGTVGFIPAGTITTGTAYGVQYLEFTTSTLGEFWIHGGFVVLDLNLTSFKADKAGNEVILKWTTSREENTDRFIIERSVDGINYTPIGSINSAGNSATAKSYVYPDKKPLTGKNFYRLQQVGRDGRKITSKVLLVNQGPVNNITIALAYLSARQIRININGKINNGTITIHDGNGRRIQTHKVNTADAGSSVNIDLGNYPSGVYPYQLVTPQGYSSQGKILLR